ncbi:MAG: divalent-cation tolerance protein CutA [Nitrospira sp.]|nr:divalent-cation tolerance protein CutA [Nitrospira sp.]MCA9474883.1 divalent-cation tolerance protein CutA [Nitrospira sp.]MCA9479323.1 divalent-cation tolerance protein CutA [Nitrospira sp.]MCB9711746.1 divalent-cation tolerance protein CutA [Nitrospiraceae bacterium]MDR4488668.1 divalent-cation tolerance protein CutA [Nitrospirales bacterium]
MNEIVVLISVGSEEEGLKIARLLVEGKVAACVNIIPGVRSIFRWKGQVLEEPEILLIAKTVSGSFDRIKRVVRENHSYEVPEIIALPIQDGLPDYLSWVREMTNISV